MLQDRPGLLTGGFCQMAYVTNDFDAALALFGGRHDVTRFLELRDYAVEVAPGRNAMLHIALAYAGGVQIEVMQPVGGDDHTYRQILRGTGGFELHHHHEAQRAESMAALDNLRERARLRGFPIVIDGGAQGGIAYFYADCRETIGHLVEYIYYPDDAFAQVCGAIPVN